MFRLWLRRELRHRQPHQGGPCGEEAQGGDGGPKLDEARKVSAVAVRAGADRHAANVLPIIRAVRKAGATTLREIADALNARGVTTARGGQWHAMTVKNMMDRAERPTGSLRHRPPIRPRGTGEVVLRPLEDTPQICDP